MLAVIFVDCPHMFTINIFGRFIVWCAKALRRSNHQEKYLEERGELTSAPAIREFLVAKAPVEMGADEGEHVDIPRNEAQQDNDIRNSSKFVSCVTRMVCKLLVLAESFQPGDITNKTGFDAITESLRSFVMLGKEEEDVVAALGGTKDCI